MRPWNSCYGTTNGAHDKPSASTIDRRRTRDGWQLGSNRWACFPSTGLNTPVTMLPSSCHWEVSSGPLVRNKFRLAVDRLGCLVTGSFIDKRHSMTLDLSICLSHLTPKLFAELLF
jgi:hypothetical protein